MDMDALPFLRSNPADAVWSDAPIPPSDVIDGAPQARSAALSSTPGDGMAVGVWECTAGRFHWRYGSDETITIVAGEARVTAEDGRVVVLREGDYATFEAGDRAIWEIPAYARKVWVHNVAVSVPARAARKARLVRRRHGVVKPLAAASGSCGAVAGIAAVLPI